MLPPDSSFTLSLGGVEFRLSPENMKTAVGNDANAAHATSEKNDKNAVMSITSVCNDEVLINLCNFNGTLRVATGSLSTSGVPVEDVPSPKIQQQSAEDDISDNNTTPKGQKKLNFFGKNTTTATTTTTTTNSSSSSDQPEIESAPVKRSSSTEPSQSSKKQRTDFDDNGIIEEEPKQEEVDNESDENHDESLTLATLGQTMADEHSRDSFDGKSSYNSRAFGIEESVAESTITTKAKDSTKNKKEVAPSSRWGQTMTMITDTKLIVYGGQTLVDDSAKPLSDLFVYDLLENIWAKPINCDGVARTWHTANFLPQRQLLLCFGGDVEDEKTGKMSSTDQVMVLDCEIMLWYPPTVSGQVPSGRSGHSASVFEDTSELVVFGGVKNNKWLNSASVLDTNRWRWSTIKAIGLPPPHRSYHSSTAIKTDDNSGNRIVIFGGNDDSKCFNTVHLLERVGNGKFAWSHPKCSGDEPKPRTGHTATLLSDGHTILIYGGWDPNTENENSDEDLVFGDSFLLDTKRWTWSKGPKPRFGATNQSNKSSATNGGSARVGHSAVLAPSSSDGLQVLAFGGRLPGDEFAADFQSLNAL